MLAANVFLAMFIVQIVVMTIVYPSRLIERLGKLNTRYPQGQFPQLYPPGTAAAERRMTTVYRGLNAFVAVAGLALLGGILNAIPRELKIDGLRPTLPAERGVGSAG